MEILSKDEYLTAMVELEALTRKGFTRMNHEERLRFHELNDATNEYEVNNYDEVFGDEDAETLKRFSADKRSSDAGK